jgi:hypothetical protein
MAMQNGNPGETARRLARLADSGMLSAYEIWRALKSINNDLYHIERFGLPVPIQMLRARRSLLVAQQRIAAS